VSSKAVEQIKGLTVGHARLGMRGGVTGSVRQEVHDGDTVNVQALGNFGVRFLATDTPEISFQLPGQTRFTGLGSPEWDDFLKDPLSTRWGAFKQPLEPGLLRNIRSRSGPGAGRNHYEHAAAAENALEDMVTADMRALGQDELSFRFFLVFAGEVMDRYGRFLCYINRDQEDENHPEPRPLSYNERMLQTGLAAPYFIWPNLNPFRKQPSLPEAVFPPGKARVVADKDPSLRRAREWVRQARANKLGVYRADGPLRFMPFELRFLSRRMPPDRWVIDLSDDSNLLIRPQGYYRIKNAEDRLFIPAEYVPLFIETGWHRQPRPRIPD